MSKEIIGTKSQEFPVEYQMVAPGLLSSSSEATAYCGLVARIGM